ncbi:hypothetical protein BAUCODRAFT_39871 [Baudoinia panamericana UAMH 10762]|uniref:Uncharacterized protein n=1 Tax=Baudoinia panamericana (strain UAMH 10762) TaxID=717646 RepID=M2MHW3_BAUPA|nr:uncharacterized protein BAUCODRAFT_39871 [Baudoinia panamericana UAMH 10762]EMC90848.1 hypothetical protein BAUCODRAFT_39871 [Baudoinia panamericana UAMH 10762]
MLNQGAIATLSGRSSPSASKGRLHTVDGNHGHRAQSVKYAVQRGIVYDKRTSTKRPVISCWMPPVPSHCPHAGSPMCTSGCQYHPSPMPMTAHDTGLNHGFHVSQIPGSQSRCGIYSGHANVSLFDRSYGALYRFGSLMAAISLGHSMVDRHVDMAISEANTLHPTPAAHCSSSSHSGSVSLVSSYLAPRKRYVFLFGDVTADCLSAAIFFCRGEVKMLFGVAI